MLNHTLTKIGLITLDSFLGKGVYAEVYARMHELDGSRVTVKILNTKREDTLDGFFRSIYETS